MPGLPPGMKKTVNDHLKTVYFIYYDIRKSPKMHTSEL